MFARYAVWYYNKIKQQLERELAYSLARKGWAIMTDKIEFTEEKNRIYAEDASGKLLAEVVFPATADGVVEICHTFVDESLRGHGVAGQLMEAVGAKLRREHKKTVPACSYAVRWFASHPESADLLKKV